MFLYVKGGGACAPVPHSCRRQCSCVFIHFHFEPVNSLTVNLYEYQLLCAAAMYVQLKAVRLDKYIYMLMHLLISAIAWSANSRNGWINTWFIKLCNMSIWHYSCWSTGVTKLYFVQFWNFHSKVMLKLTKSFTLMSMSLQEYAGCQFLCILLLQLKLLLWSVTLHWPLLCLVCFYYNSH